MLLYARLIFTPSPINYCHSNNDDILTAVAILCAADFQGCE